MEHPSISDDQLDKIKQWLGSGSINIFGLPFSGKDTHGNVLAELFDAPLLSGGRILRNSDIPDELRRGLDAGMLFPTDEFRRIVTPYLSHEEFAGRPLILSSVGRWYGEEEGVMQATEAAGHPTKAVIYLQLNEEIAHQRRARSQETGDREERADDAEHILDTRIEEFNTKTLPVIEVYRKLGLLIEVNSEAERHEVLENILARLYMRACEDIN